MELRRLREGQDQLPDPGATSADLGSGLLGKCPDDGDRFEQLVRSQSHSSQPRDPPSELSRFERESFATAPRSRGSSLRLAGSERDVLLRSSRGLDPSCQDADTDGWLPTTSHLTGVG